MKQQAGFTLIELLVAVAILAIVMAVAIPSYQQHVLKTHRKDAQSEMMELAQNLERCRTRTNEYDECAIAGGPTDSGRYQLAIDPHTATTFTITATPQSEGGQTKDKCKNLTLTHKGVKGSTGLDVSKCW